MSSSHNKYFSGFCFQNEYVLFDKLIDKSIPYIAGFSCGCIEALEYINQNIDNTSCKVLHLFSPSYFYHKSIKFKNNQLKIFKNHQNTYLKSFYQNCIYDKSIDINPYKKIDNISILEKLLFYNWDINIFKKLQKKDIQIIVYLGEFDEIVDNKKSEDFFKNYAKIIKIKNSGHLLI